MSVDLYSDYGLTYRPFRLKQALDYDKGSWFGGTHRVSARPSVVNSLTRHLCTLALSEKESVAIFASLDYGGLGEFNFFRATYKLFNEQVPLMQFVVHSNDLVLDEASPLQSEMSPLKLMLAVAGKDPECLTSLDLGTKEIYQDHKVGGIPYFEEVEGELGESLELLKSRWVHLLQLAFPSQEDDETPGNWPFGESIFHVFCRFEQDRYCFKYCWG